MKATELVRGRFSIQLRINLVAVMSVLFVVVDEGVCVCVCVCVCRSVLFKIIHSRCHYIELP